jgi:hypothetical protein
MIRCDPAKKREDSPTLLWLNATMKASVLYLATAITSAVHVIYLAGWGIWGAPTNRLYYVSFAGSLVLGLATFLAPFRFRAAAIIGLIGSVAVWCFYAPALIYTFLLPSPSWSAVKQLLSYGEYVPALGPIAVPVLLSICTAYAALRLRRPRIS